MQIVFQMPPVQNGNASSLRQLINHVSSHMNALQALSFNVPIQDLMLYHLMLATLDTEAQREWELNMASRKDNPNDCRISHIFENKMQSLIVTSDHQVTEVICYHSTFVKVNWRQVQ